ncbi:MAG TPA: PAC2 family protein [Acidimicrobiia bacterium]|nr:PAC2 family protein [Acidimicrobiia bacterium]
MAGLVWEDRPRLRRPVMVAGFEGWNDAGDAASDAATWIVRNFDASCFAWIDPEEHFDFQSNRPRVELVDGVTRRITWPENRFYAVATGSDDHDLVVLRGVEPNLSWRSFCASVIEVARSTGCELVVTLGALLADVPHTRPVRITGSATDPELIERLHLQSSRYEGPTGIVGVLHDECRRAGLASVSLWAPVPHYVASPPNPPATRELLARLADLTRFSVRLDSLDATAVAWREQVSEAVAGDDDVRAYVSQLERQVDEAEPGLEMRSGESIAAELERYLREREQRGEA